MQRRFMKPLSFGAPHFRLTSRWNRGFVKRTQAYKDRRHENRVSCLLSVLPIGYPPFFRDNLDTASYLHPELFLLCPISVPELQQLVFRDLQCGGDVEQHLQR